MNTKLVDRCKTCRGFGDVYENKSWDDKKPDHVKVTCPSCHGFAFYPAPRLPTESKQTSAIAAIVNKYEEQFR